MSTPAHCPFVSSPRTNAQPVWPSEGGGTVDLGSSGGVVAGTLLALLAALPSQASVPAGPMRSNEDESCAELTPPPDAPSAQPVPAAPLRLPKVATPPDVSAVLLESAHVPLAAVSTDRVTCVPSGAGAPLITKLTVTPAPGGLLYAV